MNKFLNLNIIIKQATVSRAALRTTSSWVPHNKRYVSQGELSDGVKEGFKRLKNALCPAAQAEHAKKMHLSIPKDTELHLDVYGEGSLGKEPPCTPKLKRHKKTYKYDRAHSHMGPIDEDREYVSQSRQGAAWNSGSTLSAITEFVSPKVEEAVPDMGATDELRTDGMSDETGLEKFLSRPVKIFETTWQVGDALRVYNIFPWKEFLTDIVIANKTNNYAFIQGKMHIKVLINGTQWHYGKSILSYRPLQSSCELERAPGNAQYVDNIAFSQRPNVVIDPTESEAGEMTLPFIWYNNWLSLSSTTELENMGELVLSSYNPLANAAGGTEGCSISIFAYMSDVKLSGPTSYQSQSSSGAKDEYGDGVVSQPASAVAKFARQLTTVPWIGPYARATELGAAAVSNIAKLFGFSRPINVGAINKYRPTYLGNIANGSIPEAVDKLTIDPKQELTIDPRVTGYESSEDDLNIKKIVTKESYLGKFRWSNNNLVDSLLWNSNVTPRLWEREDNVSLGEVYHLTPMCLVQQAFEFWRGSVEFRFDVAASKFHKGRLRLVWDPLGTGSGVPDWAASFNRVIDLSKERSFTVKIGMNQALSFLGGSGSLQGSNENHSPTYENTTPVVLGANNNANGVLRCYVLNRLIAPDDATDPVEINVFVKMCDDAEFAVPRNGYSSLSYVSQSYISQSEDDAAQAPRDLPTTQEEIPVSDIIGEKIVDTSDLIHFGETITSFRQPLKRYSYANTRTVNVDRALGLYGYRAEMPNFPASPGEDSVTSYGPQFMTLMGYLTPCFAARRGGVRWKHVLIDHSQNVDSGVISQNTGEICCYRQTYLTLTSSEQEFATTTIASGAATSNFDSVEIMKWHGNTDTGAYLTVQNLNNTVEVEIPYQTNRRFNPAKLVKISDGRLGFADAYRLSFTRMSLDTVGNNPMLYMNSYCAAGEDFSLSMFVNVPPMYNNSDVN